MKWSIIVLLVLLLLLDLSCSVKDCCDNLEGFPVMFEVVDSSGNSLILPDTTGVRYSIPPEDNHHNPSITKINLDANGDEISQYFKVYEGNESDVPFVTIESDLDFPSINTFYVYYAEMSTDTIEWEVGREDEDLQVLSVLVNREEVTPSRTFRIVK